VTVSKRLADDVGPVCLVTGTTQYHAENSIYSAAGVNITEFTSVKLGYESLKQALIKTHGQKQSNLVFACFAFRL